VPRALMSAIYRRDRFVDFRQPLSSCLSPSCIEQL